MTEKTTEERLIRLEYAHHALDKKVDAHIQRLNAIDIGLEEIKTTLRTIKWVSIGILFGLATAAMDWDVAIKLAKAIV